MRRTHVDPARPDLSPGGLVAWQVGGRRPPLVCLHGAGVSSRELLPFVAARSGIRETWSLDLPGFGASSGPPRPLGITGLAEAVEAWRDAAGLGEVFLLGCSFGCQIAVETALRAPEAVRGLVLVGPTTDPSARSGAGQLRRWLRNSRHEPRGLAPLTFRDYRDAGIRRVLSGFAESIRDRIEDKLPSVAVPTLVVRGEHDALVPHDWARRVTSLLPEGRLVTWSGAAHMVPYAAPRGFGDLVEEFLTS